MRHGIVVSVIKTGHARYVAGTHKESNHWFGRAATIVEVDGRPVNAGSSAAADLWKQLLTAPRAFRPDEIGAPWAAPGSKPALVLGPRREVLAAHRLRRRGRGALASFAGSSCSSSASFRLGTLVVR